MAAALLAIGSGTTEQPFLDDRRCCTLKGIKMTRIVIFGLCLTLNFVALRLPVVFADDDRPNILFCFADDWGRYASIYADVDGGDAISSFVSTPNIDRVGHEGVVFRNAFVAAPSCTPSRAAVTSGMYFFRCGRQANLRVDNWTAETNPYDMWPGFPALLQQSGYLVGHTAKTSAKKKGEAPQPRFGAGQTPMSRFSQTINESTNFESAKQKIYDEVRDRFREFLANRKDSQPFLYWFGPHNCHRPWIAGSGKKMWGIDPDDLEGKLPAFLPDKPVVREDVADYLGEVQAWDAMVGVLLAELERLGELENTLIVLSGDHGMPGMPYGKCNVYDFGVHAPLLISWTKRIPQKRIIDDFVNLMDLAPTFLESAGVTPPETMQARSFLDVLTSDKDGTIDGSRNHVIIGQERHVPSARAGGLPYPKRAIRTKGYLYIRNFHPERWPMGDPRGLQNVNPPDFEAVASETYTTFADMDASPTKAWLVTRRHEPQAAQYYQWAFGKRPAEELYDLEKDPDQVVNVAGVGQYAKIQKELTDRLMSTLRDTGDPRLENDAFDHPPYIEP